MQCKNFKRFSWIAILSIVSFACFFVGNTFFTFANGPVDIKDVTIDEYNHKLDDNIESLSFDDLYCSSLTDFDENNSSVSMFGGFIETGKVRIEKSFAISYVVTVSESADANSVFGLGIRNVTKDGKANLIKSGGYEILFGHNERLDGIAGTSAGTVSVVKNGELAEETSEVVKYAVFDLPAWFKFEQGNSINLTIGSIRIVAKNKPLDTIGYYNYVEATIGNDSGRIATFCDYCDNGVNIGSAITGVVSGAGKYKIYDSASDAMRITEELTESNTYDILQLDKGSGSYYEVVSKGMFGRARTATALSLEVSMRIIVDTPVSSWHMFDIGLKNCYNGEYDHFNGGYDFRIGRNRDMDGGNTNDTLSIMRNGLYDGKNYHVNAVRIVKMPNDFKRDMYMQGASLKLTLGLQRIMSGNDVLGYYAYMKYNDEIVVDFYDYFDYAANIDYFGDVFTGGIEKEGAYYITTCGEVDREFEQVKIYDLSSLVPVTATGLLYAADAGNAYTEKVISRYMTGEYSVGIKYNVKFKGTPKLDLSLLALDDSTKADSVRFRIDCKHEVFRVYSVATKTAYFDSGEIDFSAAGFVYEQNREYLLEYGVIRYKYKGCEDFDRAQVYIKIDGTDIYRYNIDYMSSLVLGYYVGGRVTGSEGDSVNLIPTEANTLSVEITADKLKERFKVGERNAIVYQSTVPMGLAEVEYRCLSGAENVSINEYGTVTALKDGTAVVKVIVKTQYGVYESNEVTLTIDASGNNNPVIDYGSGCSCSSSAGYGNIVIIALAVTLFGCLILIKRKKNN